MNTPEAITHPKLTAASGSPCAWKGVRAAALAARGKSPASHRDRRGARPARREEGEYREYSTDEQRRRPGCIAGRMQRDFYHGLLGVLLGLAGQHAVLAQDNQQIMPNYRDADIRQVIEAVGAVTGRNFLVDPACARM